MTECPLCNNELLLLEEIQTKLKPILDEFNQFSEVIEKTKEIPVTEEDVSRIMDIYVMNGNISNKTKEAVMVAYLDHEIQQVPNSLWGLVMTISWVGINSDMKTGVAYNLWVIAGEILLAGVLILGEYKEVEEEDQDYS